MQLLMDALGDERTEGEVFSSAVLTSLNKSNIGNQNRRFLNLRKSGIRTFSSMPSSNPFKGLLANHMQCNVCGHESSPQYQPFSVLSLPLPEKSRECTLEKCLELFSSEEVEQFEWNHTPDTPVNIIRGGSNDQLPNPFLPKTEPTLKTPSHSMRILERNTIPMAASSWQCSTTGKCSAVLKWCIAKPPKSLCLHLRRLGDPSPQAVKIGKHVKFPTNLKLLCKLGAHGEDYPANYLLTSVIVHSGDAYSGHFTCFRKITQQSGKDFQFQWFHINDEQTESVDEQQVLNCEAYMLFYDRNMT